MLPEERLEEAAEQLRIVRRDHLDREIYKWGLYQLEVGIRGHAQKFRQGREIMNDAEVVE